MAQRRAERLRTAKDDADADHEGVRGLRAKAGGGSGAAGGRETADLDVHVLLDAVDGPARRAALRVVAGGGAWAVRAVRISD